MRGFIRDVLAFGCLQLAIAAGLSWFYEPDPTAYVAALEDKSAALASTPSPRLIVVGGSNVALGLDSAGLASSLPYNPVNLGLHAGLGVRLMLELVEEHARPGDVVVVSFEYQQFTRNSRDMVADAMLQWPGSVRLMPAGYFKSVLDDGVLEAGAVVRRTLRLMAGAPAASAMPPYVRNGFNRFGDVVSHWRMKPPGELKPFEFRVADDDRMLEVIEWLNEFHAGLHARGVRAFFSFPPLPPRVFASHRRSLLDLERTLRARLTVPVLDRPGDLVLPRAYFFDTPYHLTRQGAHARSEKLAGRLKDVLKPLRPKPRSQTRALLLRDS